MGLTLGHSMALTKHNTLLTYSQLQFLFVQLLHHCPTRSTLTLIIISGQYSKATQSNSLMRYLNLIYKRILNVMPILYKEDMLRHWTIPRNVK